MTALAETLARADADAHRLWRAAFGLASARHLTIDAHTLETRQEEPVPATTSWADAPPVWISPRLHATGHHQRRGGPVDIPDPVQQAPPAAQRPGVGQMPDRLLHQRTQPRLAAVERPLPVAEAVLGASVLGASVPDRRVPVLAGVGHAPKPPVQQACDAACVQHFPQPRQLDELLLVAAPGPAPVAPQQVAPDGAHRQALGGVGVAFGVVEDLLVDPSAGSLHPGGEPVDAYRLAGACHFHQPLAQVGQGGDEGPVGLAVPRGRPVDQAAGPGCRRPRSWRSPPHGRRAGMTARRG